MSASAAEADAQRRLAADVAQLVCGLQVPISLPGFRARMGDQAYDAWERLMSTARGPFGWANAEDAAEAFGRVMGSHDA